jgi:hypothetical protein
MCLYNGLVLPHMTSSSIDGNNVISSLTPFSMIANWISSIKSSILTTSQCIDYLVSFNTEWLSHVKEIDHELYNILKIKSNNILYNIIIEFLYQCNNNDIIEIFGVLDENNIRNNGKMDIYLNNEQINYILEQISYHLLTEKKDYQYAILLYSYASLYIPIIEHLNYQLINIINTINHNNITNTNNILLNNYWVLYSIQFFNKYFNNDNTIANNNIVMEQLYMNNKYELRTIFEILLNIIKFIELYQYNDR